MYLSSIIQYLSYHLHWGKSLASSMLCYIFGPFILKEIYNHMSNCIKN